jgi:hypothetical protein
MANYSSMFAVGEYVYIKALGTTGRIEAVIFGLAEKDVTYFVPYFSFNGRQEKATLHYEDIEALPVQGALPSPAPEVQVSGLEMCPDCKSSNTMQWINHPEHGYYCHDCKNEWGKQ